MQYSTVGARLREVRRSRQWTQTDLAHFARVSASDVCKIERDRLKASDYQIGKLAAALNIPAASLNSSDVKKQAG